MSRPLSTVSAPVPRLFTNLRRALLVVGGCLLVVCGLGTNVRAAGSLADLDRDNGLPNAQLGAPLSSFQGLEKTEDTGRWLSFRRPSDNLHFGKYEVAGITYNFFKERLYSIVLTIPGKGNVKGTLKLLDQMYGKDHTNDTLPVAKMAMTVDVHEWAGTKVYCIMKNGSDFDGGELRFLDRATWDALQIPKKEKLEASKQMLSGSFVNGDLDHKPEPSPAPETQPPKPPQ